MHYVRERAHPCHIPGVDGRDSSLLSLRRVQGLGSDHQAWQQSFYLMSHLVSAITLIVFLVYLVYFVLLAIVPGIFAHVLSSAPSLSYMPSPQPSGDLSTS